MLNTYGFTLIEFLTVIGIVVILAAILVPIIGGVRETATNTKCLANLRQMGAALLSYSNERAGGNLPPAYLSDGRWVWTGSVTTGHPVNYGYLQYEGYLGGIPNVGLKGNARSGVFNCPSYSDDLLWDTSAGSGFGEYFYTVGHVYYDSIRDRNGVGLGVPVNDVDPDQAVITDIVSQSLTSSSHRNGASVNALYIDGSVQNIKRANFLTNNRLTAFNRREK